MNADSLMEYFRRLLSGLKESFGTGIKRTHKIALIVYLFLILSIEAFLAWEGSIFGLLIPLGGILAVLVFICPIILKRAAALTIKLQKEEMDWRESIVWVSIFFIASFGVLLCWYLSFYPGAFSSDAIYQYEQALSGKYNDWKPILQTLITFTLPMKLTGRPESIVLFQIIEFSGVLAYMSYIVLKYSNRIIAILALSYILLNPVTGNILIYPWKDATFAMFAILLMTFGFQIYVTNGEWLNSKKSVVLLGIVLTVTTIVRHNGFFFTIPFLIAVFLHISKKRRLQVLLVFLICTGIIKGPINHSLEVPESWWSHSTRVLGLPMSVLGNIAKEAPEAFDDTTAEFVFSVASKEDWENSYICGNFEYLRWNCNLKVIEKAGAEKVLWMAAKASLKAPAPAAKAIFSLTDMVYTVNGDLDWDIRPDMAENAYGLEMRDLCRGDGLNRYTSFSKTGIPKYLFWYVGVINLIVMISLLSKCRFRVKKDWGKIAFALPLLCYNFGTMLLLSYSNFRYFYFSFPICPIIILILFGEKVEGPKAERPRFKWSRLRWPETEGRRTERISINAILIKVISLLKSDREIAIFMFLLFGSIIMGAKLNLLDAPYGSSFLFTDLIWLVFYWLLLSCVGGALIKWTNQHLTEIQAAKSQKKWWLGGFLLLVLLWTPYLFAYYPGILTPDSITSLLQAEDLSILHNHVPVAYTLMVALFARLGWLVGDANFGVAVFSFAQLVIMAAVLSYSVYWIRTRISRNKIVSAGLLLFYGLNPIIALYSITMWKDVLFSGWIVLFCLFLGDAAISEGKVLTEKNGIKRLCILLLLVSFGRNNGIYVVILSWIIISVLYKKFRKKVLAICGGVILLTLLIQGPGYKKLGIGKSGFVESVGIPIQQVSYTVIHDETFAKEDLEFLEKIIPIQTIKESYSPLIVDNIKFNSDFNTEFFEENKIGFIKLYLKWLPTHFTSYVQSYLLSTEGFWHMKPSSVGWIMSDGVCENELGIYGVDCLNGYLGLNIKQTMGSVLEFVRRLPITDTGLMVWLVFFYVLICFVQKQSWKALITLPMLGCWLTIMIATPVSAQFRYVYYYYLMLPIVCILIFVKKKQAIGGETGEGLRTAPKGTDAAKEGCCGCQACQDICPAQAIHMRLDSEGFWYPEKVEKLCTECGACEKVCPMKHSGEKRGKRIYAGAQAKEDRIRYSSSSGGMFSILANYVLERQGVVYGAGFNQEMLVAHKGVCGEKSLESIRKTKYVQSDMNGIYREVREHLRQGRWVLFCGTPCQVRAMRLFAGSAAARLILADLICYGAASPGIWKDYVNYLEHRNGGSLTSFSFRDKRNRDSGRSCSYVINRKESTQPLGKDPYCRLYFGNYMLRPACHSCGFCTVERDSDFTLGDFWGIEKVRPAWDDGMGTSLVIMHTQKAEEIWQSVREDVRWFVCEKEDVLQPRLVEPTKPAKLRGLFMKAYRALPFRLLMKGAGG